MSETDDILAKVQEAFKAAFGVDTKSVTLETKADDVPGWDSVGHLSLAASIEEVFGLSLDVDDLMEMESVSAIVRIIGAKLSKKV
jgi:acyl carrier protein